MNIERKHCVTVAFILIFLLICAIYLFRDIPMQYNEVAIGQLLTKDHGSCVYYCTMKLESDKKDIYSFSDTISKYDYDFENHIYIVTFGYELSNISYSRMSRPIVHEHGHYNYFIPKVWLSDGNADKLYVYELPKVNIDSDADDYTRKVFFVDK